MLDVLLMGQGGPHIGTGHWVRLLALSRALVEQGLSCALQTDHHDHPALKDCPIRLVDPSRKTRARILVQDPPRPDVTGEHVVCLVDGPGTWFHADLVIYPHFGEVTIGVRASAAVLSGPQYAPLRPPFGLAHPECKPKFRAIERVLVSCGGSRLGVLRTAAVCEGLKRDHYTPVPMDWSAPYFGNVVDRMRSCDAAITTASMTAMEALCLGLPLITTTLNAEQERIEAAMAEAGVAASASLYALGVPGPGWTGARHGWEAVDGLGIYRVAASLAG